MGTVLGKISVETPKYDVVDKKGEFEVRRYNSCVVAEVSYDPAQTKSGRDGGFMILAGYIGAVGTPNNQSSQKIAMTAPVITADDASLPSEGNNVVVYENGDAKQVTMRFVLPSTYTVDNAPKPTDPRVEVKPVPETKYGVLKFSGGADDNAVKQKVEVLKKSLEEAGYKIAGNYLLARYNPPWTPGFLRTNEVMLPVQ